MHQNRVDPEGEIRAVPARGHWMGNRGCLHDAEGRICRSHRGKRWITCLTAFRGRKRALMQPGRYTELFFLDEATAYAAGHRPCAECRRADWRRFMDLWAAVHGAADSDTVDSCLHAARLDGRTRRVSPCPAAEVPPGAMARDPEGAVLRGPTDWWRWGFSGYRRIKAPSGTVTLLTPAPMVALMARGLPVQMARGDADE